jgi:hypothetical protein
VTRRTETLLDLAANLAWPWAVLTFVSDDATLGPRWGPAVAMIGPLVHAVWRRMHRGRTSPLSVLVIVSIGLNAALGFVPLDASWFAWKEAALPVVMGLGIAATALRGPGLVRDLVEELLDPAKLAGALAEKGAAETCLRRMRRGTIEFGLVSVGSGVLSGIVARMFVTSPTGSAGFAAELGRYTAWSYALVNLPALVATALVLRGVLAALEDGTGRTFETLLPD